MSSRPKDFKFDGFNLFNELLLTRGLIVILIDSYAFLFSMTFCDLELLEFYSKSMDVKL